MFPEIECYHIKEISSHAQSRPQGAEKQLATIRKVNFVVVEVGGDISLRA